MPYPKDTIGLQNPNLVVTSVSYCTQCENTGRYILGIIVSILNLNSSRKRKKDNIRNYFLHRLFRTDIDRMHQCL